MSKDEYLPPSPETLDKLNKALAEARQDIVNNKPFGSFGSFVQYANDDLEDENWDDEPTIKVVKAYSVKAPPFTWQNYPATYTYLICVTFYFICIFLWALKVF